MGKQREDPNRFVPFTLRIMKDKEKKAHLLYYQCVMNKSQTMIETNPKEQQLTIVMAVP